MRRIVVFRHGILLNRYFLWGMERFFLRRGYEVHNPSYRTTRKVIEEHAKDFADDITALARSLEGQAHRLCVITHSLGGLVFRYAMTHYHVPPVHAAVLFAPPNRGAQSARYYWRFPPYRWLYGTRAGRQLAEPPPGIFTLCGALPGVPVGILAGDVPWKLLPGPLEKPHDGVVSVREAALPPLPLKTLPYGHTPILFRRRAWQEAAYFIENEKFRYP